MSGVTSYADWIAVDWGTTHLRAWAMVGDTAKAEARSDDGMGKLQSDGFEPALLRLIEPWLGQGAMPVLACGMVGARQGWIDTPYQAVPAHPAALSPVTVPARDRRLDVRIVPGLSQADPADIMRGEETQIAGFLVQQPHFDGVLCLPGTHSKWVRVSAQEVVSFQTNMTGELFDLLAHGSVLRHSITPNGTLDGAPDAPLDQAAFTDAVSSVLSRPEQLAQRLFSIRAEAVLNALDPALARARLSGLLIGAELAAAKPYWLGQEVAIAGNPDLAHAYAVALQAQGVAAQSYDAGPLTRAGLARIHAKSTESA